MTDTTLMSGLRESFGETPSQTVGPYFAYCLTAQQYRYDFAQVFDHTVALPHAAGEHIRLEGRVLDGDGQPIPDALVEIQQADAAGRYRPHTATPGADFQATGFRGFGRSGAGTEADPRYHFDTVKPGAPSAGEAPHLHLVVMMRGMLLHAFTRVYFADEADANARDAALQSVPAERRDTLLARREQHGGRLVYRFDIHMQGPRETVFFDV